MNNEIADCPACGLRYMRHAVAISTPARGKKRCSCGQTLAEWYGAFELDFEPEDPNPAASAAPARSTQH